MNAQPPQYSSLAASDDAELDRNRFRLSHKLSILSDHEFHKSGKFVAGKKAPISLNIVLPGASDALNFDQESKRVCEFEHCGAEALAGCCTYKILSGLSKGCNRAFCESHSGTSAVALDFD